MLPDTERGGFSRNLILLTERGYAMLAKSFNDDLARVAGAAIVEQAAGQRDSEGARR
jgi:hypothetical protein